jgi:hypothetical protein
MAALCRILIAATLVVHLTMGCCSHHAHSCQGDLSRAQSGTPHDGQYSASCAEHSNHGANDCHGERCVSAASSRVPVGWPATSSQTFVVASLDERIPRAGFGSEQCSLASGRLLLPVRLHLANQVLLI